MISTDAQADGAALPGGARKIAPVVRGLPIVGALPRLLRDPLKFICDVAAKYPREVVAVQIGPARAYLVTHPDHVQHVFLENGRNYDKQDFLWRRLRSLFGTGLVASDGPAWARNRRIVLHSFKPKELPSYSDLIVHTVAEVIEDLGTSGRNEPIDMLEQMLLLVQRILLRTMFSTSISAREMDTLQRAGSSGLSMAVRHMFFPGGFPLPGRGHIKRCRQEISDITLPLIHQRRSGPDPHDDLLARLASSRDEETGELLSEQEIRDEIINLVIAGTGTTAITLTWLWYQLALHPEMDRQFRDEIDIVLGGRPPLFAELRRFEYMTLLISEVIRLYPPGWLIPKSSRDEDCIGGYPIEAGGTVMLSPYVTHRMAEFWDRPLVFDPTRFGAEPSKARHRFAYYPFGGGPHMCIGNHFSFMEMVIIASMVAQRYRPRLASRSPIEPRWAGTLQPRGGMPMFFDRIA
jgi:enediyne biosynthesis protein E7